MPQSRSALSPSPRQRRAIVSCLVAALALIGAAYAASVWLDRELLTRDIDALTASPALTRYAAVRAAPVLAGQCAVCHGDRLEGNARLGVPSLTDREWLYGDGRASEIEKTLAYGIRSGHPKSRNLASMPAFARARPYERSDLPALSPQQIDDVVAYVRGLAGAAEHAAETSATPAPSRVANAGKPLDASFDAAGVERGRGVFNGVGSCFDCHAADARGDNAIGAPSLRAHAWLEGSGSAEELRDVIAYGRAGACPAWSGRLAPATVRAVAVTLDLRARDAATPRVAAVR